MISDYQLMKISLVIVVIGIICLLALYLILEPEELSIKDITTAKVGHEVIVSGFVESLSVKDDHVFITLKDNNSSIKVVMFANIAKTYPEIYNLTNEIITIRGTVDNYKGELEIVANKLS